MQSLRTLLRLAIKWNLSFSILNQAILSLGAVLVVVSLSNLLTAEVFGKTRFLASVLAIAAFFSLPGIGAVILQQASIYSRAGFMAAIVTQLRWGIGATVGAFFFALIFYFNNDYDLAVAFMVSGLLAPVANLYLMPGLALAGLKRSKEKLWYDSIAMTAIVLGATLGATLTGTVAGTMIWYFGFQTLATVGLLYLAFGKLPISSNGIDTLSRDAKYGKQLTLFQLPFTLLPALEKALVFLLLGPVALAIYVVVTLPIEHLRAAWRNFLQFSALPQLSELEEHVDLLKYWLYVAIFMSAGVALSVVLFGWLVLPFLFSDYLEAQPLIYLSSLLAFFLPVQVYVLSMIARREVNRLYIYAAASVFIDVLVLVFLTTLFGLYGAVFAKLLAGLFSAIIVSILSRSQMKL